MVVTRAGKRRKKGNKPPKKRNKRKKKPVEEEKKDDELSEEQLILEVQENDDPASMTDLPKPRTATKYASKAKENAKNDWSRYYSRHRFEYLRRGTVRRIMLGYPVRYDTLARYDLIEFYKANTPKANLKKFKFQEIFEKRAKTSEPMPYTNEIGDRVRNAFRMNEIGTSVPVENIKIIVNGGENLDVVNVSASSADDVRVVHPPRSNPQPAQAPPIVDGKYPAKRAIWMIKYMMRSNKSKKNPPDFISKNSVLSYVNAIKNLVRIFKCGEDLIACFKNTERVLKRKLTDSGQDVKNMVSIIARSLPRADEQFELLMGPEAMERWRSVNQTNWKKSKKDYAIKKKTEKIISYDKIRNIMSDLKEKFNANRDDNNINQDFLAYALYLYIPPMRDDYTPMKIVKDIPIPDDGKFHPDPDDPDLGIVNYYGTNNQVFCFQNYKMSAKFGQLRHSLKSKLMKKTKYSQGKLLAQKIDDSLKAFPRDLMFVNRNNPKSPAKKVSPRLSKISKRYRLSEQNFGKNVGTRQFRHIYVTHMYKEIKLNDKDRKALAKLMAHDQGTAENVYERMLEGEEVPDNAVITS